MIPTRTKIICTIGPATQGIENLSKLINLGMDTARLNFSHGTHDDHLEVIKNIRSASEDCCRSVAILQDLQGPKIRIGKIENGEVFIADNSKLIISVDDGEYGNENKVYTNYKALVKEVKAGNTILLDDGYIILCAEKVSRNEILTSVVKGGNLKSNKGIIVPGVPSSAPPLSEKDLDDLKFGLSSGVDAVALSFVRSERDIIELKTAMKIFGRRVPIIAKIERSEAIENIDSIIKECDGIMVARGDLGLEMPAEQVPVIQKEIIKRCNYYGKPAIIATQMLESMINNPRPTRAEASDVANAVLDGADCVMLSAETSVGKYPFEAVDYMDKILRAVEEKYIVRSNFDAPREETNRTSDALGKASCLIAEKIKAAAIVPLTSSGYTAKNIAKYRPFMPVVALTPNADTQRNLSFVWGVNAILIPPQLTHDDIYEELSNFLKKLSYIKTGDLVVFVAGLSASSILTKNILKVYEIE